MEVPREVLAGVGGALDAEDPAPAPGDAGPELPRVEARIGGGCIHPAVRVRTRSGRLAFLKWTPEPGPTGFGVEARGLEALRARGGVAVPEVIGWDPGGPGGHGWLLLEWVPPGDPAPGTAGALGSGLARLHRSLEGEAPGWSEDGWIATLPQKNPPESDWPTFWGGARLLPRWRTARESGRIGTRHEASMERLLAELPRAVAGWEADGISLLHGDLWSGNVLVARDGTPYLVDPAAYRGHREVDLAMMQLFGGFGSDTFRAYEEERPLAHEYRTLRRAVYQLYPLLVHVNLFGGGYVARTIDTLEGVLAELG